jgi:DNA-binding Lrp family transcriptional regulator
MSRKIALDQFDYAILEILQKDATISNKKLAKQIGLSPPTTLVKVNQIKQEK